MRLSILGLENTHPPHCSPEMYCQIIAGSWRIKRVGNCSEKLAELDINDGVLSYVSE